jgi:phage tail sheath gpL-like
MEKAFETKYGTITLRTAMFDVDGTTLIEGTEVVKDDEVIAELVGVLCHLDETDDIEEVEAFLEEHCDERDL